MSKKIILTDPIGVYSKVELRNTDTRIYLLDNTFGSNYVLNADGDNTTDWIDSNGDGLGDSWTGSTFYVDSIINGYSGFTNNAQRSERIIGAIGGVCPLWCNDFGITDAYGRTYYGWL